MVDKINHEKLEYPKDFLGPKTNDLFIKEGIYALVLCLNREINLKGNYMEK